MQKSKHRAQVAASWRRVVVRGGVGCGGGVQRAAGSTQRITMVTAIRGLRGARLGQRGRLERQLTEESALALDDSTDSSPQGSAGPALPRDRGALQNGDVASSPSSEGK